MRNVFHAPPNLREPLWRYLKTERFVQMLESGKIHFAAATQFADRFEGAVAVMPPDFPVDPRYGELDDAERAFRELKRLTKINCWHRADYENDAMWKLYASESKGVAICTTPERIRAAAHPFRLLPQYGVEDLWFGAVEYVDLLSVRMHVGMHARFFFKHKAFSWEREFRLAISVRTAEEFGVQVPELGIEVAVDLSTLIDSIVLGPCLSEDEVSRIRETTDGVGLTAVVRKSSLLGQPRYI